MADYREIIDRVLSGDYDDAPLEERTEAVQKIINACSIAAGAVTIQPLPLVDMVLISPIQIAMVQAIGRVHGQRALDQQAVLEMLSTFGASIVAQNVVIAGAKFVPFFGWAVSISMAYALTWAIGEVADHYFKNGRGVPQEELREMFKSTYERKKAEKQAAAKGKDRLKDKLQQLKEAREAELLTEEEFQRKKEELLAAM